MLRLVKALESQKRIYSPKRESCAWNGMQRSPVQYFIAGMKGILWNLL